MQLTPIIAVHMTAALTALVLGPVVIWTRLGRYVRPWLHRGLGYAWVTMMVATAISAVFIRDDQLPNVYGYTWIHLLVPISLISLFRAFRFLAKKDILAHKKTMLGLYIGACVVAGAFTLLPSRYLGHLVWHDWLALVK